MLLVFFFDRAGAGSVRAVAAVGPTVRCPVIDDVGYQLVAAKRGSVCFIWAVVSESDGVSLTLAHWCGKTRHGWWYEFKGPLLRSSINAYTARTAVTRHTKKPMIAIHDIGARAEWQECASPICTFGLALGETLVAYERALPVSNVTSKP
jgi:hypothetical protein